MGIYNEVKQGNKKEVKMVKVKKEILQKLEKRAKESGSFKNVDEYINYILKQVVDKLEKEKKGKKKEKDESAYSKSDEEKVKERLRSLGYLD